MPYLSDMRKREEENKKKLFIFSLSHNNSSCDFALVFQLCTELKIFAFKALGQESIVVYNPHTYYVSAFGGVKEH